MKRIQYEVTVKVVFEEDYPYKSAFRDYVKEAVGTWGGQYHPEDIFFPTNIKRVTTGKVKETLV